MLLTVLPFYQAKQVNGVAVGLKGVYDLEYCMANGVNIADEDGNIKVLNKGGKEYPKDHRRQNTCPRIEILRHATHRAHPSDPCRCAG
ncbi:MAG: hypothetical protein R2688_02875 [Fimbriimonadaceae bacterium]